MAGFGDLHHVGITVRDLEESLEWYQRVFDVKHEFIAEASGPEIAQAVGVPNADFRFAFLRFGSTVVELLCYSNDSDKSNTRSNSDVGSAHVCIHVNDVQASYEALVAKGVEFLSEPVKVTEGPLCGATFVYFKDPNGVTLELITGAH